MDKDLNFILNNSIEYHGLQHDEGNIFHTNIFKNILLILILM